MSQINNARGMTGRTNTEVESKKLGYRIANLAGSVMRDAGSAIEHVAARISNDMQTRIESIKEHLNPKNIGAAIKNSLGGLSKAMGGMALSMGVMILIRPLLAKLQPAMEKVQKSLEPFIDRMVPIIMKLLNAFMPLFIMLINTLMPPLLDMFGFLLTVLGFLVKGIATLAKAFGAKGLADGLSTISNGLNDASSSLHSVASDLRKNPIKSINIEVPAAGGGGEASAVTSSGTKAIPATYNVGKGNFVKQSAAQVAKEDQQKSVLEQIADNTKATADNTQIASYDTLQKMTTAQQQQYYKAHPLAPITAGSNNGRATIGPFLGNQ